MTFLLIMFGVTFIVAAFLTWMALEIWDAFAEALDGEDD